MNNLPVILAIETSCDETAVAITKGTKVLSSLVSSQIKAHQPYGGVVPELASRKHVSAINFLIDKALEEAKLSFKDIDAVAVSGGPGLVGALMVGVTAAKTLAFSLEKPLIAINHIEAHIFSVLPERKISFPLICLVASGGHTMLVNVKGFGDYEVLGQTLDDAAGEAFDKVAKVLGMSYPGGPQIEKAAKEGNKKKYKFPKPLIYSGDYRFSFSGLKTAVIYKLRDLKAKNVSYKPADMAASFQDAASEVLVSKTLIAAMEFQAATVTIVGGVASNSYLRERLEKATSEYGIQLVLPAKEFSTDNAAMVGFAASHYYKNKQFSDFEFSVNPNWPLPLTK
ncbi:MAG TPA: tRNA (adenosine(37)-N6)-threonylcarbamoyltransferase complex transferase subunit TsaD [Actinobacteria bacterium]|nr:tRNA (adenosine(37)-N6)-threonylcarbamoyltransferase complex transferase subunit TsaD [Actinomycetota bacterium]